MGKTLLGQILGSIVLGAINTGEILLDPKGFVKDPAHIDNLVAGFLEIWAKQPANVEAQAKAKAAGA